MLHNGAAAGTISGVLGFTNEGTARCRLAGWPTVVALGPAEEARARRTLNVFGAGAFAAPPQVVLRPGTRAVAVYAAGDHPAPPLPRCGPAYRRLVTPPGSTVTHVVPARIPNDTGLLLPACTPIRISPVVPFSAVPYLAENGVSRWQRRRARHQDVSAG